MKFKDSLLSKYEKPFVNKVVLERKRLDGRSASDYRNVDIQFGKDWGVCIVSLGETRVMAQVTCDVQQPKSVRPNEGMLFLNVEVSQMAMPGIEQNVMGELHVHLNRLLEKCIKESHCVDLESLCIVAEEKVWNIRVDVTVLNNEGNLIGCASIATIAALSHFKRPDVTTDGETFVIHDPSERDLIPLSMRHYPLCITYAVYDNGNIVLADPSDIEERCSQAELVLGMNAYRELCGIHLSGTVLQELNVLIKCSKEAADIAANLVRKIKKAIEIDDNQRKEKQISCLVENIDVERVLPPSECRSSLKILSKKEIEEKVEEIISDIQEMDVSDDEVVEIKSSGFKSAKIVQVKLDKNKTKKEISKWSSESDDTSSEEEEITKSEKHDAKFLKRKAKNNVKKESLLKIDAKDSVMEIHDTSSDADVELVREITYKDRIIECIELTGDSEEEEVVTMTSKDMETSKQTNVLQKKVKNEDE